jgi:hypothetical protein
MKGNFELVYGYIHCRGKTTYSAGYVDTREEAEAWVRNHRDGIAPKLRRPPDDPICYCRAAWCPFKKQKPWFDIVRHQIEAF